MKKLLLILLAVVSVTIYSCQKENQSTQKLSIKGTLARAKKDTVPPASLLRKLKDTVPPAAALLRDTVPPSLK